MRDENVANGGVLPVPMLPMVNGVGGRDFFKFTPLSVPPSFDKISGLTPRGSRVRDTVRRPRGGTGCVRQKGHTCPQCREGAAGAFHFRACALAGLD